MFTFAPDKGKKGQIYYPPVPAVDQGDLIGTPRPENRVGKCTIGWIADGVIYTAGHCARPGDEMFTLEVVEVDLETGNDGVAFDTKIGTFHTNDRGNGDLRNDVGWVAIENPWVRLGENGYSGDRLVPFEDIQTGLEVCAWGQRTKIERCGEVLGTDGADIILDSAVKGNSGDSGGPVWAKDGSGFVGVYSGRYLSLIHISEPTRRS